MEPILMIPELSGIPWLYHGFGTNIFSEADLDALAARHGARPVLLRQVHSARILAVEELPAQPPSADASITNRPGFALVVKTADCLPLLLVDPENRAVAAVHAGWRGTAQRIASAAVEALARAFGSRPSALLAALGPCIGASCYEVGEDVRGAFSRAGLPLRDFSPVEGAPGKYFLDLRAAGRAQLEGAGVPAANIFSAGACTHCDRALLSFRRDRRGGLRLFNFIGLDIFS
jgi:hypothetical protein